MITRERMQDYLQQLNKLQSDMMNCDKEHYVNIMTLNHIIGGTGYLTIYVTVSDVNGTGNHCDIRQLDTEREAEKSICEIINYCATLQN